MISGIVLAGGHGTRMGAYKPLLLHEGRPLLHHALDALAPHCDEVLVLAGARAAEVSRIAKGARVLGDPVEGPHVALALGAQAARHHTLLVVPADLPRIHAHALAPLLAAGVPAVYVIDGVPNPLLGLYARGTLLEALAADPRSLQVAARALGARHVDAGPWAPALADADTPGDLA